MFLYGASGHAKVIIDILELQGEPIEGIFDDNTSIDRLLEYSVETFPKAFSSSKHLIISIGDNYIRKKLATLVSASFGNAIHPSALLSRRSSYGVGTVIMGGVTINSDVKIGNHCIVNTNASIDHDCIVEDFVHISPNVALCGNVQIGEGSHIGAGAVIIPGKKIGKWCVIGAGAVVISDVPDYCTSVGNPSKVIKCGELSKYIKF
jgi:acetyltransferase EpsM